jgi:hypothetical protein
VAVLQQQHQLRGGEDMAKDRLHVTQGSDGVWRGTREGAGRASTTGATQQEVEQRSRDILRQSGGGELITHRPNGQIRESDTVPPKRDEFPPRG